MHVALEGLKQLQHVAACTNTATQRERETPLEILGSCRIISIIHVVVVSLQKEKLLVAFLHGRSEHHHHQCGWQRDHAGEARVVQRRRGQQVCLDVF